MIEPEFVGQEPKKLVQDLLKAYWQCVTENRSLWVSFEGPPGCGKSRIVHEFYRELAKAQRKPYWPNSIHGNTDLRSIEDIRKVVHPKFKKTEKKTYPDFMWWGIRCDETGLTPSETLESDLEQFSFHSDILEYAYHQKLSAVGSVSRSIKSVLTSAYSGGKGDLRDSLEGEMSKEVLGEVLADISGLNLVKKPLSAIWNQRKRKKAGEVTFREGVSIGDEPNLEPVDAAITLIRNLATGGVIPVILYIEDLHSASDLIVELINKLLNSAEIAVIIVTTCHTGEIEKNERLEPLKRASDAKYRDRIGVVRLRQLEEELANDNKLQSNAIFQSGYSGLDEKDKVALVRQYFPTSSTAAIASVLGKINTPHLLCLSLAELQRQGYKSLDELTHQDVAEMPRDVHDHYDKAWNRLPDSIKNTLLYGLLTVPHVVNRNYRHANYAWSLSLIRSALASARVSLNIIEKYESEPRILSWISKADDSLSLYRDWVQFYQVYRLKSKTRRHRPAILSALSIKVVTAYKQKKSGFGDNGYLEQLIIALAENDPSYISDNELLFNVYKNRMYFLLEYPREIDETIRIAEKAMQYSKGMEINEVLSIRQRCAVLYDSKGDLTTSMELCIALLSDQKRILGEEHSDTLTTRSMIANTLGEQGEAGRALDLFTDLQHDYENILGQQHSDTLAVRGFTARWTGLNGDSEAAEKLFTELIRDQEKYLEKDDQSILTTRFNLTYWLEQNGKADAAFKLLGELLIDAERILGHDHVNTLSIRAQVGRAIAQKGNIIEALQLLGDVLLDREIKLGKDHLDTLAARNEIGFWTAELGEIDKSLEIFGDLLLDQERILNCNHPMVVVTKKNISYYKEINGGNV